MGLCTDVTPRQRQLGDMPCQLGSRMMLALQTKLPNTGDVTPHRPIPISRVTLESLMHSLGWHFGHHTTLLTWITYLISCTKP